MVTFQNVTKRYPDGTSAVEKLNLAVERGELVVFIGPSGCGKTTSLKMVNRLIQPSSGRILVDGRDTAGIDPVQLRRSIGYVIQQIGLMPHLSIEENIGFVMRMMGAPKAERRRRVEELLTMVGMDPDLYRKRLPRELSGGQQQRIGVLRALSTNPELILMDEPFGALDPLTRDQLQDELKRLQTELHKTIIFVTHDMGEALRLADRIVVMRGGEVVQCDAPDDLLRHPADPFVSEFIGRERMLRRPEDVQVAEVMLTRPTSVVPERGLAEALELMRRQRVDSLMVVDENGRLRGALPVADLQWHLLLNQERTVGRVMSPITVTVSAQQTVREAVDLMVAHKLRALPVVDENGRLQGLITRSRLVDVLAEVFWNYEGSADEAVSQDHLNSEVNQTWIS